MLEELWSGLIGFTEPLVVPDWGSLVGLLPLMLAVFVVLYVTWTAFRFATAAPTRRGIRRQPPAPPAGVHMPGPSFAPILGAFGMFMLVFGLIVGGLWLWVGVAILVITLLYWGREALRDYDRLPAATAERALAPAHAAAPAMGHLPAPAPGALTPPADAVPPPGVHVPPPTFRPLLVAVAMTILVAGLVIGGWALIAGAAAIVVAGLGWLRDARREYLAVERADRSGHLDLGGAPAWPTGTFAALALIIAGSLLLTSGVLPNAGGGTAAAPSGGPAVPGGGGSSAPPSLPTGDVTLSAENLAFSTAALTIPAGKPFTLVFDNRDTAPHDVVIKDGSGTEVFRGEVVTGPKVVVYEVPAIPAGQYNFLCSIHPTSMTGTVTAQ